MISQTLHALGEKLSSWRPAEVTRELATVLPTDLGIDPAAITRLLDRLTTQACRGDKSPGGRNRMGFDFP